MHFPFYVHVDLGFQLRRALGEAHFLSFHAAYIAVCWLAEPFSPLCPQCPFQLLFPPPPQEQWAALLWPTGGCVHWFFLHMRHLFLSSLGQGLCQGLVLEQPLPNVFSFHFSLAVSWKLYFFPSCFRLSFLVSSSSVMSYLKLLFLLGVVLGLHRVVSQYDLKFSSLVPAAMALSPIYVPMAPKPNICSLALRTGFADLILYFTEA